MGRYRQSSVVVGRQSSRRPTGPIPRRPLGYGREAYVWSLLAAIGLFVVGALRVNLARGQRTHRGGEEAHGRDYVIAYIVLGISFVLEGISFLQAFRQLRTEAHGLDRDLLEHALETSDPTVRAVFAEDAAALGRHRDRRSPVSRCTNSPELRRGTRSVRSSSACCSAWSQSC